MLTGIHECITQDLQDVHTMIGDATQSSIDLIQTIGQYALNQPGRKLIRPTMVILFARALDYHSTKVTELAAIIELIHSATLLHDDVIDHAKTRRNKLTTHSVYGGTQSILMGDFIYASAFKLIANLNSTAITHILAQATQEIVEGEILQLGLQRQIDTSIEEYQQIIRAKTSLLFSTSAQCIAKLCPNNPHGKHLYDYAHHFGMLYQITDDILDIDTQNKQLNKAHGTDLSEGKMTLPTILAYQHASEADQDTIKTIIGGKIPWQDILPIMERTNALKHCQPFLKLHTTKGLAALEHLPDSIYKEHLKTLLEHIPLRKK